MDALSLISGTVGVAAFCVQFIDVLGKFVVDAKDAPDSIRTFYDTVVALQGCLQNLAEVLKNRPKPQPYERAHYANIHRIIQSCHVALEKLQVKLPTVPTDPGAFAKAKMALAMTIKSNTITQTLNHINSYNSVLQLDLMTLSLGTLWGTQRSNSQTEALIHSFMDRTRSASLAALKTNPNPTPEGDPVLADANLTLQRDIQAWMTSADDVAATISLHDRLPGDSGIDIVHDSPAADDFDPEPEMEDAPSREILQHQFDENQKLVEQLVKCGVFLKASFFQRKGIEQKKRLAKALDMPYNFSDRTSMEETLADILVDTATLDRLAEAKEILQNLLSTEVSQPTELRSEDRRCRLYYKLGKIALDSYDVKAARRFLIRAFEGRRKIEPIPMDLVAEAGDLLVRAHQLELAYDEASGVMKWMQQNLRRPTIVPDLLQAALVTSNAPPSPSSVGNDETIKFSGPFAWCKDYGFDVDQPNFRFDECDSTRGTSPLHLAVREEATEVVLQMTDQVVSFEHRDDQFCTPLLLASETRNYKVVQALLEPEHGAKVDVRDRLGRSPLHRCQNSRGGIKVAEMLLSHSNASLGASVITARPEFVNLVDQSSKTALYLACEKGNEKMVHFLLANDANPDLADNLGKTPLFTACERGNMAMVKCLLEGQADPNIQGPGQCTPLIVAIEMANPINVKMHIIEMLSSAGADPNISNSDGQNAFIVAKNYAFGSEVRRHLQLAEPRRFSTTSTASSNSSRSREPPSHQANSSRPRAGPMASKTSRRSSMRWLRGYSSAEKKEVGAPMTSIEGNESAVQG